MEIPTLGGRRKDVVGISVYPSDCRLCLPRMDTFLLSVDSFCC